MEGGREGGGALGGFLCCWCGESESAGLQSENSQTELGLNLVEIVKEDPVNHRRNVCSHKIYSKTSIKGYFV